MSEILESFFNELNRYNNKARKKEAELRLKIVEPYFRLALGTVHDSISIAEMPCTGKIFCKCKKDPLVMDMRSLVAKGRRFLTNVEAAAKSSDERLSELNRIIETYIFSGALRQKNQDSEQRHANNEIEAIWRFSKV